MDRAKRGLLRSRAGVSQHFPLKEGCGQARIFLVYLLSNNLINYCLREPES